MFTGAKFIDRHALVLAAVTLDGAPARVTGIREDVATVTAAHTGAAAKFTWPALLQAVNNGGILHTCS